MAAALHSFHSWPLPMLAYSALSPEDMPPWVWYFLYKKYHIQGGDRYLYFISRLEANSVDAPPELSMPSRGMRIGKRIPVDGCVARTTTLRLQVSFLRLLLSMYPNDCVSCFGLGHTLLCATHFFADLAATTSLRFAVLLHHRRAVHSMLTV
eukprot:scaffold13781_cov20-Tisochrysis_lutea.AAC.1